MRLRKNQAITFIELLVAMAIMSLLIAISGPAYRSYMIKSQFAAVIAAIGEYRDDMAVAYTDNDQFPATLDDIPVNTYTAVSSSVLQQIYYKQSTDKQSAYVLFFTLNLGISNYVPANNSGTGGVSARVALVATKTSTGNLQFHCGQWDGTSADVPLTYLPQSCQDTNLTSLIT